jgi:single-strand DNA-binding protein
MVNEASFSVAGYVATEPKVGWTKDGTRTLFMRLGWTPRRMDKTTGNWVDQASSFVSVICYRKVAENAAACLRRGDPVMVKGNLRVREFGDESPKRIAVEVIADTIGHDLSRGVTFFKKSTEQLEKTALEREHATAAAARAPLPGDRGTAEPAGPQPHEDYATPGDADYRQDPEGGYPAELDPEDHELADGEVFDDEEARQMLADAGEAAEPVGAAT